MSEKPSIRLSIEEAAEIASPEIAKMLRDSRAKEVFADGALKVWDGERVEAVPIAALVDDEAAKVMPTDGVINRILGVGRMLYIYGPVAHELSAHIAAAVARGHVVILPFAGEDGVATLVSTTRLPVAFFPCRSDLAHMAEQVDGVHTHHGRASVIAKNGKYILSDALKDAAGSPLTVLQEPFGQPFELLLAMEKANSHTVVISTTELDTRWASLANTVIEADTAGLRLIQHDRAQRKCLALEEAEMFFKIHTSHDRKA
jgi:hypothetical protein